MNKFWSKLVQIPNFFIKIVSNPTFCLKNVFYPRE